MTTKPIYIFNPAIIKYLPKKLSGKICLSPYISIMVNLKGDVGLCGCAAWMPTTIGNLFNESLHSMLSSKLAQDIRQSIRDGSYEFCNANTCGIIKNDKLNDINSVSKDVQNLIIDPTLFKMPHEIVIAGDETCNLSCPSCRTGIKNNSDDVVEKNIKLGETLRKNLFGTPTDDTINIMLSTTGEIFASPLLLSFVNSISIDDFPNVNLKLQTNGLLAERFWHKLGIMQDRVTHITVTVDAATEESYEILRRGGKWKEIQSSLAWLQQKKKQNNMHMSLRMIVQNQNYKEMLDFYHMSKSFGADKIEYSRLTDWKTYSPLAFRIHDVFARGHENYQAAHECLNAVRHLPDVEIQGGL
jgi:sulfatase maturation enzyme AslB (radical SAM superfamily)